MKDIFVLKEKAKLVFWGVLFLLFMIGIVILVNIPWTNRYYKIIYLLFMTFLGAGTLKRRKIKNVGIVISWFGFLSIASLSALWSIEIQFDRIIVIAMINIAASILFLDIETDKKLCVFMNVLLLGCAIQFVYVVLQTGVLNMLRSRFELKYFNSNGVGQNMAYAAIISLFFFQKKSKKYIIPALFFTVAVVLTGSRLSLLMLLGGAVFFFISYAESKNEILKKLMICIITMLLLFVLIFGVDVFYNIIGKRIWEGSLLPLWNDFNGNYIYYDNTQISNNLRAQFAQIAWRVFSEHPLLGVGIDNYKIILNEVMGEYTYAHSNILELLSDLGIVGTIFYYYLYIWLWISQLKQKNVSDKVLELKLSFALLVCIGLQDIFGVSYYSMFQKLIYIIAIFILLKAKKEGSKENENRQLYKEDIKIRGR